MTEDLKKLKTDVKRIGRALETTMELTKTLADKVIELEKSMASMSEMVTHEGEHLLKIYDILANHTDIIKISKVKIEEIKDMIKGRKR